MIANFSKWIASIALTTALCATTGSVAQVTQVSELIVEAPFEDVLQDLRDGVINRGYNIDYQAHIGAMLDRTAGDVGGSKRIYVNAELVQFCSAVLSRKVMEADPANIAFCPYILFAYERADQPGTIHVGFRRLSETGSTASKAALAKVNDLLDEIIAEAADQ